MSSLRLPGLNRTKSVSVVQSVEPNESQVDCCSICRRHAARYTCPRCSIPYCSVPCYRTHGTSNECTESFYKDRVSNVLQLEVKEKADDMIGIMQRQNKRQDLEELVQECTTLSPDELLQLLSLLERHEDDEEEMARVLSQTSMRRFRTAIGQVVLGLQHGHDDDLHEWIVDQWYPWWRAKPMAAQDNEEDDGDDNGDEYVTSSGKTLDDRIIAVPSFATLCPRRANSSDNVPPLLQYNLVDILCSTVHVLWLYHGAQNATTELPLEAYTALVQRSVVLSRDARYTELDDVLTHCRHAFGEPKANEQDCDDTAWRILFQDVALICQNHRFVSRALLEMCDIVKAAVRFVKREATNVDAISNMQKVGKKLQFYLSWSLTYKKDVATLKDAILEWTEHNR